MRAWTEPAFEAYGEHFKLRYVNTWRSRSKPHPPSGSRAARQNVEFVAKRRYAYMGIPYFT
jgi:hypothetical protein